MMTWLTFWIFILIRIELVIWAQSLDDPTTVGRQRLYGEECQPFHEVDTRVISIVDNRERELVHENSRINKSPLCPDDECDPLQSASVLDPGLWTEAMSTLYVKEFFQMFQHCNQNHLLSCQFILDAESDFKDTSSSATTQRYYNVLKVPEDVASDGHWLCRCNPNVSYEPSDSDVDESTVSRCLAKVGTPCLFRADAVMKAYDVNERKFNYQCGPGQMCFPTGHINTKFPIVAFYNTTKMEINACGVRQAMRNYALIELTHVCLCNTSLYHIGNGSCVHPVFTRSRAQKMALLEIEKLLMLLVLLLTLSFQ